MRENKNKDLAFCAPRAPRERTTFYFVLCRVPLLHNMHLYDASCYRGDVIVVNLFPGCSADE